LLVGEKKSNLQPQEAKQMMANLEDTMKNVDPEYSYNIGGFCVIRSFGVASTSIGLSQKILLG
jgi:hypothetical protein